jgi:hypothetical protein
MDTRYELRSVILVAAEYRKKREGQHRRTTRDLRTPVAKCIEVDGEDLGTFVVNCNRFVV